MEDERRAVCSLLIADDEYLIRERLKRIIPFEELGLCLAGEAQDGEEALEKAAKLLPDIAIVDINMPFINGLELIRAFKGLEKEPVVVILSGYDEFAYAREAIRSQVSDYLVKPVEPPKLKEALGLALRRLRERQREQAMVERHRDALAFRSFLSSGVLGPGISASLEHFLTVPEGEYLHLVLVRCTDGTQAAVADELTRRGYGVRLFPRVATGALLVVRSASAELPDLSSFSVSIAFDGPFSTPEELISANIRCERTLLRRFFAPVPLYGRGERPSDCAFVENLVTQLERLLEQGSAESASSLVRSHLDAIAEVGTGKGFQRYVQRALQAIEAFREREEGTGTPLLAIDLDVLRMLDLFDDPLSFSSYLTDLLRLHMRSSRCDRGGSPSVSERAKQFIDNSYADPTLDLAKIARFVGFHPNYVSARFKEETGIGISQYVKQVRLSHARRLLETMECQEVAWAVGFSDPYYFSKCYKKHFGVSPSGSAGHRP